jgi:endonuclease YncB( thermonuclease family)
MNEPTLLPPSAPVLPLDRLSLVTVGIGLVSVSDGDTIVVQGPGFITAIDRIRLLGIDAPERGEQGWGHSREYLGQLVRGQQLRLEGTHGAELTRGRCNRILAWLWAGDVLVNWSMVLAGWARSETKWGEGTYTPKLNEAAEWARVMGMPRRPPAAPRHESSITRGRQFTLPVRPPVLQSDHHPGATP